MRILSTTKRLNSASRETPGATAITQLLLSSLRAGGAMPDGRAERAAKRSEAH